MSTRDEIASLGFDEWIASFCKRHEIKCPNRGSYARTIIHGLFDNLKNEMEVTTSLENRLALLSGAIEHVSDVIGCSDAAYNGSGWLAREIRAAIKPAMERIKQWKRRRTSTSKSSQG